MITCHKCNEPATAFNNSPEMREWIFWWCNECDTIVIPLMAYIETDLSRQLAHDAHRGTSFSPDKRADQEIMGYMAEMKEVSERFTPFVTTENEAPIKAALEQYRQGYLKHLNARLAAKARCLSTTIAGPSGFNHRRAEKANSTEHKRTTELLEWREKALARLNRDYNPVAIARRPIRSDEPDAIEQIQAKIEAAEKDQRQMKSVNRIVKSKKLDEGQKAVEIDKLGLSQELLTYFARVGEGKFPGYRLTNNNANIKRMKVRVITLVTEASRADAADKEATIDGTPVTIIENREEGRIQLVFDGRPPKGVIELLKTNVFKWSRTNEAWQRLLNDNSRRVIADLVDKELVNEST